MKTETEDGQVPCPQVTIPLQVVPVPEEQVLALTEPSVLFEEVSTTVVTTVSEAVLASGARTAANAKNKALQSMQHQRPMGNCGVWSTAAAFLQTQVVEFDCNSMLDEPGYLRKKGK